MELTELENLITQAEGEKLEFKTRMPNKNSIVSIAAAFANTNGGKLVIGVEEGGNVIGIKNTRKATKQITPNPIKTLYLLISLASGIFLGNGSH